ncbi:MAG: AAA family ATPase [Lachnospiraceae bacterium]|nr:AAA family ATPase [Lachnospiraceae bacterium]
MIYLSHFDFPGQEQEESWHMEIKRTCYDSFYPFYVLTKCSLQMLDFEPVTILYGGNGSGKSTVLNVIAEKLHLKRDTLYNRSNFFEDYTRLCRYEKEKPIPDHSRIITSDDVFDFMLTLRGINEGVDLRREELLDEYLEGKYTHFQMKSLDDYDRLKKVNASRTKTQSKYVRQFLQNNLREHSNGESALMYFEERMQDGGLYLLDEPENSLAPERQMELKSCLEVSALSCGCQLVIATHSPFLLSLRNAKIYDLDENPADVKRWTELPNVRKYFEFFEEHRGEFL